MAEIGAERMRLTRLEQERIDLGYLHPAEPRFAQNALTLRLRPEPEEEVQAPPRVTFYAQPGDAQRELELPKVWAWLDPNKQRFDPLPGAAFVPSERRTFADGILGYVGHGGPTLSRFLAVRRTGTVEYAPYCAWVHQFTNGRRISLINLKLLLGQWEQFLRFLAALGAEFGLATPWRATFNVRNAAGAVLVGYGKGWAQPFQDLIDVTTCEELHLQFETAFSDGPDEIAQRGQEIAERLEYAYGHHEPRVYNRIDPVGAIEYDVRYM